MSRPLPDCRRVEEKSGAQILAPSKQPVNVRLPNNDAPQKTPRVPKLRPVRAAMSAEPECRQGCPRARILRADRIQPVTSPLLVPACYRPWIKLPSSMTLEIGRVLGAPAQVHLLFEGRERPARWERKVLSLPARSQAFCREVALVAHGEVAMLARSLTPRDDPFAAELRRLRRKPLAEILFQDARWSRSGDPLALRWRTASGPVFGRACLWQRQGDWHGSVLVEEYFLAPLLSAEGRSSGMPLGNLTTCPGAVSN